MTIWKVCRLCLKEDENSLTEHTAANSLIETIFTLTSLQVLEFPIESVYLCEECEKLLVKFHLFRESCLANDIIFHQTVQAETLQRKDIVCSSHVELMKIEILSENDMEHAVFLEEDQVSLMEEENNSIKPRKISKPKSSAVKKISVQKIKQKTRGNNRRTTKADTSKKPTKDEVNLTAKATKRKPVQQRKKKTIANNRRTTRSDASKNAIKKKRERIPCTKDRYLPCTECGKLIVRRNILRHLATHNPDEVPVMNCSYCGKLYRNPVLLKVHINTHHTFEKKYECTECNKVYLCSTSLRVHTRSKHSVQMRYECKECGLKFSTYSQMRYHHKAKHTEERPHACQFCEKAFKFRSDLTLHTRTHTGEKPFACDICGKKFNKSYNVVIHKKSHANQALKNRKVNTEHDSVEGKEQIKT